MALAAVELTRNPKIAAKCSELWSAVLPGGAATSTAAEASPSQPAGSSSPIKLSPAVALALAEGRAVVALESTIISHGMPYPQNLQTALEVEAVIRERGAVPATIAVIQGVPCVGLDHDQLEHIARKGLAVHKVSRRDLPFVMAQGLDGATTVCATMLLAHLAGIHVFVTGGIGGVHRDGHVTLDISADLTELGRTPVAVICAGAKSVLDIPRTLEVLETQGVCVAAYGVDEFPAFFSRSSGCKAPCRVDHPAQVAKMICASLQLGLGSGMLLAVPVPEQYTAEGERIEAAIRQALQEAQDQGVSGNEVTPFLLDRIRALTGGQSLETNIALVRNNAAIGAAVAVALAGLLSAASSAASSSADKGGAGGLADAGGTVAPHSRL